MFMIALGLAACSQDLNFHPVSAGVYGSTAGWAVSAEELSVFDGTAWVNHTPDLDGGHLLNATITNDGRVSAVSATGDVEGSVRLFDSPDAGESWSSTLLDPHAYRLPTGATMSVVGDTVDIVIDTESNVAFSYGVWLRSTDGGKTWMNRGETPAAGRIVTVGEDTAILGGGVDDAQIYRTDDAGRTWTAETVGAGRQRVSALTAVNGSVELALTTTDHTSARWSVWVLDGDGWTERVAADVNLGTDASGFPLPAAIAPGGEAVAVVPATGEVLTMADDGALRRIPHALSPGGWRLAMASDGRAWGDAGSGMMESVDHGGTWRPLTGE